VSRNSSQVESISSGPKILSRMGCVQRFIADGLDDRACKHDAGIGMVPGAGELMDSHAPMSPPNPYRMLSGKQPLHS
jgi:hypothetical protein